MKFKIIILLTILSLWVSSCSDDEASLSAIDSVEAKFTVFMRADWLRYFDIKVYYGAESAQLESNGQSSIYWYDNITYVKWQDKEGYPRLSTKMTYLTVRVSLKDGVNLSKIDPDAELDFSYDISAEVFGCKNNQIVYSYSDVKEDKRKIKIKGSELRDFVASLDNPFFNFSYSWEESGVLMCDINSIK
ncbi:MAG: hypothetical protein K2M27_11175 [Muribaculaceae bacterium]|nr:hypothetical protein [Muribaculaceae bacterium]